MKKINYLTLDCETTGLNTSTARVVELSIYDSTRDVHHHYVFNPTIPIPLVCSELHGIYDKDIKGKPTFADKAKEILKLLKGKTIISYNGVAYDIPLLQAEFKRCNLEWNPTHQIDCMKIYKLTEPNKKLSTAYIRYCNKEIQNAHTAKADVAATYEIFKKQQELFGTKILEQLSKGDVKETKAAVKVNLEEFYFGKHKGKSVLTVIKEDRSYCEWVIDKAENVNSEFKKKLKKLLNENKG